MPEGHVLRRFVLSTPLCLPHLILFPDLPFPLLSFLTHSLFLIPLYIPYYTCLLSFPTLPVVLLHSLFFFISFPLSSSLSLLHFSASSLQIYNALGCNKRLRASFTIMSSLQVPRGLIELRPFRSAGRRQECLKMGLRGRVVYFDLLMRFVFYAREKSRTYVRQHSRSIKFAVYSKSVQYFRLIL